MSAGNLPSNLGSVIRLIRKLQASVVGLRIVGCAVRIPRSASARAAAAAVAMMSRMTCQSLWFCLESH